jgi:hypothetical protein
MKFTRSTIGSRSLANSALRITPIAAVPWRALEPKSDIPACSRTNVSKSNFDGCGRAEFGFCLT